MKKLMTLLLGLVLFNAASAQFINGNFEQSTTCIDDCTIANSQMDCVPGWEEHPLATAVDFKYLQKAFCPEDNVCNGKRSIYLLGTSGSGGASIATNNPVQAPELGQIPALISLNANILPESNLNTFIKIEGLNGLTGPVIGQATSTQFGVCEELLFPLATNAHTFEKLGFIVSGPTAHIDIHRAIIDDVTYCGSMFTVDDKCEEVEINFSECLDQSKVSNVAIEWFDQNGLSVFENYDINIDEPLVFSLPAGTYEFDYFITMNDGNVYFNIDPVVYEVQAASFPECCEPAEVCRPLEDLTACAEEGDYGFIYFDCEAQAGFTYSWITPTNTTAIIFNNDGGIPSLLQASEGEYTLVILEEATGCTTEQKFTIEADCCEPPMEECVAPTGLECKTEANFVRLYWEEVPSAQDYIVTFYYNDPSCGCNGVAEFIQAANTNGDAFYDVSISFFTCFSWSVQSVCKDGELSDNSTTLCFSANSGCYFGQEDDGKDLIDPSGETLQARVFPNTSSGYVNFELRAKDQISVSVEVYNLSGKLVKAFAEETHQGGLFQKNWLIDQQLSNGIYYVVFKTDQGIFQEKMIISKK